LNLRRTTILSIITTFLLLGVVLAISQQLVFSRHFQYEESQQNILNMQRVQSGFENQFTILNYLVDEWSAQIETWETSPEDDETATQLSLMEESFSKQGINAWLILNQDGTLWKSGGMSSNLNSDPEEYGLQAVFNTDPALLEFQPSLEHKHGILIVDLQPWLISMAKISNSSAVIPQGILVVGHIFDETDIQTLADQVKFPIRVSLFAGNTIEPDFRVAQEYFQTGQETTFLQTLSDTNLAGYVLLTDFNQQPALILRADQYRFVARNATLVMRSMLLALVAAALVFAALFFGLIERTMLSRLVRLDKEVQVIAGNPLESQRVSVDGKDEITSVSTNINHMIDSLGKNQQERLDELNVLLQVSQLFLEQKNLSEVRNVICLVARQHFNAEIAWLGERTEENKMYAVAAEGVALEKIKPVTLFEHNLHNYLLKPVFVVTSRDLFEQSASQALFYAIVLPLNWGRKPQALYLFKAEEPHLTDQDQQFLASFARLCELVLGNIQLIEEVKSNQERLQELSHRLVKVHEEERRHLARELHDEIGQYLTALKLRLSRMDDAGEAVGKIEDAQELLNELIRKVRQLSLDLRPNVLDDLGLIPALKWYFERYTQQTGIAVDFDPRISDRMRFSNEVEISIYRIIQESLTNVARHASVQSVLVELSTTENQIELLIEDEGSGFIPNDQKNGASSGLTGMIERARLLQGEMQIQSQPGQGTRITVHLPLEIGLGV